MNHCCHTPGAVHQRTRERVPRRRGTAMSPRGIRFYMRSWASKLRGVSRSTSAVLRFGGRNSRDLQWGGTLSSAPSNVRRSRLYVPCWNTLHTYYIHCSFRHIGTVAYITIVLSLICAHFCATVSYLCYVCLQYHS